MKKIKPLKTSPLLFEQCLEETPFGTPLGPLKALGDLRSSIVPNNHKHVLDCCQIDRGNQSGITVELPNFKLFDGTD